MRFAIEMISGSGSIDIEAVSDIIETEPLPLPDGQDPGSPYLNAVLIARTSLTARRLLDRLLEIEEKRQRTRAGSPRWAPRTLDLDLLLFDDLEIDEPGLRVPHPRMLERRFVLGPLMQLTPEWAIPGSTGTVSDAWLALIEPAVAEHPA